MQTLEKELITIYRDIDHEKNSQDQINSLRESAQQEVDKFKAMDLGELTPDEFYYFVSSPHYFIQDRWAKGQEAPAGWDRANYLKLLTKPDDSHFVPQHFPASDLVYLEEGEVKINEEAAKRFVTSQTYQVEKDSKAYKAFQTLQALEKSINKVNEAFNRNILNGAELAKFFQEPDLRFSPFVEIKLDIRKVINSIERI